MRREAAPAAALLRAGGSDFQAQGGHFRYMGGRNRAGERPCSGPVACPEWQSCILFYFKYLRDP
jgi:hypothetical protein